MHPDKGAATKEAGPTGAAFDTEADFSEAIAAWPASRLVDVWNGFAGAPPFAELKEVKRFTDRKSAVARIWNAAQRLGETLEEEMKIAEQDMLRAQQEKAIATKPAKVARTAAAEAPAQSKATPRRPPVRTTRPRPSSAKERARPRCSRCSNARAAQLWRRK